LKKNQKGNLSNAKNLSPKNLYNKRLCAETGALLRKFLGLVFNILVAIYPDGSVRPGRKENASKRKFNTSSLKNRGVATVGFAGGFNALISLVC